VSDLKSRLNNNLTEINMVNLTPADAGILAAVLDDNRHLGDDDITEALRGSVLLKNIASSDEAYDVAYDFFRANV
jgi:hypothetical protein